MDLVPFPSDDYYTTRANIRLLPCFMNSFPNGQLLWVALYQVSGTWFQGRMYIHFIYKVYSMNIFWTDETTTPPPPTLWSCQDYLIWRLLDFPGSVYPTMLLPCSNILTIWLSRSNYFRIFFLEDCGPPVQPVGGTVVLPFGTQFGQIAFYSCDSGYVREGPAEVRCSETGKWSHNTTCQKIGQWKLLKFA